MNEEDNKNLMEPIKKFELEVVLKGMKKDKILGMDGRSMELYVGIFYFI